jgi:hypothetical protein
MDPERGGHPKKCKSVLIARDVNASDDMKPFAPAAVQDVGVKIACLSVSVIPPP